MATRVFTRTVLASKLHAELVEAAPNVVTGVIYNKADTKVTVNLSQEPTLQEDTDITSTVNAHVPTATQQTTTEDYLALDIETFIKDLMLEIRAENMLMGITQLDKTTEVLGFFEEQLTLPGRTRTVSLNGSLTTASLTTTLEVLAYRIANPSQYSDLSPFVTVARLTDMYNKIATKLGIPTI